MTKTVLLSDLVKLATIEAFGDVECADKYTAVRTPYVQRTFSSYKINFKSEVYPFVLEWKTNDYLIQFGIDSDLTSLHLHAILVRNRNKGLGTHLMNVILDHCDDHKVNLKLHPFPLAYAKDAATARLKDIMPHYFQLKKWYESFGFVMQPNGEMIYKHQ